MVQHYVYGFYAKLRLQAEYLVRKFEINGKKTVDELGSALMLMFEMQVKPPVLFQAEQKTR